MHNLIDMADLFSNDIKIVFLRFSQIKAAAQGKQAHFYRSKRVSNAVRHTGSQPSYHCHFFGLKQVLSAAFKFGLGLIHIFQKALNASAEC